MLWGLDGSLQKIGVNLRARGRSGPPGLGRLRSSLPGLGSPARSLIGREGGALGSLVGVSHPLQRRRRISAVLLAVYSRSLGPLMRLAAQQRWDELDGFLSAALRLSAAG